MIPTCSVCEVKQGMQGGVAIVVKRLKEDSPVAREKAFNKEVEHIMALQHENLAKLVGFCREVQAKVVRSNGKYTVADHSETLLCYEYLPGGSLDKYIFGKYCISYPIRHI
jgi:disease resistance protein RPM1